MSLADFYARIGPYLLGQRGHAEVVQLLYGDGGISPQERLQDETSDAARLEIYGRFCRIRRQESLVFVFVHCARVVIRDGGEAAWEDLVERYYVAHPMHHFEFNQNGIHFPAFVEKEVAAGRLPAFLSELADFEWWEWIIETLRDEPADADPDAGPLRLHSTVELRPYTYDLVGWIDDLEGQGQPKANENAVLFWRNPKLRPRRAEANHLEMLIIKAVVESIPLDDAFAARLGVSPKDLQETVADLHSAGILLGALEPTD